MRRNAVLIGAILGVAVCRVIGLVALGSPPDATDSGAQIVRWFRQHAHDMRVGLWFTTFAMVFFGALLAIGVVVATEPVPA